MSFHEGEVILCVGGDGVGVLIQYKAERKRNVEKRESCVPVGFRKCEELLCVGGDGVGVAG